MTPVLFVAFDPLGFPLGVFDNIEAAQLAADQRARHVYGEAPWYPSDGWYSVIGGISTTKWERMLYDRDAPEVDYEGECFAIWAVPSFLREAMQ